MNLFLINTDLKITVPESLLIALVAMAIIISILVMIQLLVHVMTRGLKLFDFLKGKTDKALEKVKFSFKKSKDQKTAVSEEATIEVADVAPGSCGKIKLHDVSDKDAAMIMSIVAHKLKKPINELRFISIKEIKE